MEWKRRVRENTDTLTVGPQSTTTTLRMPSARFQLGRAVGCMVFGLRKEVYGLRFELIAVSRLCQLETLRCAQWGGSCEYQRTRIWLRSLECVRAAQKFW